MLKSTKNYLVTACDAVSANYISSLLKKWPGNYYLSSQGVATKIFKKNQYKTSHYSKKKYSELKNFGIQILKKNIYDAVITGTSWGPTIDKAAILGANYFGLPSISILDHWSLYIERFSEINKGNIKKKLIYLPKKLWVPDQFAYNKMRLLTKNITELEVVGNPYLQQKIKDLKMEKKPKINNEILFISEKIKSDFSNKSNGYPDTNEEIVLNKLIKARKLGTKIIIKLHPQEKLTKYSMILKKYKNIIVKKKVDFKKKINSCKSIVGISSMMLLEAALIRNDVVSVIPAHKKNIFIGNKRKITQNVYSVADLTKIIYKKKNNFKINLKFQKIFKNSTQKCLKSLKNIVN